MSDGARFKRRRNEDMFELFLTLVVSGLILEVSYYCMNFIYTKVIIKNMNKELTQIGEDIGEMIQKFSNM